MREADVCLELFLEWLAQTHGRRFRVDGREDLPGGGLTVLASAGPVRLAVEAQLLLGPVEDPDWLALRDRLAREIAVDLPDSIALWIPPGADLPSGAAGAQEFVQMVRQAATILQPQERSFVPLPITIYVKKMSDEGNLVMASGGLSPYWAHLTELVRGSYGLDSTRLHRLPESEEHLEQLIETIWQQAREIESPGQGVEIETIDAWTIQRLEGHSGVVIVGLPPQEIPDMGVAVRRNLRRILADSAPRLRQREADLRALVVLGHYVRLEQEGATTALRGYDPALYTGLEFVCLAADGLLKPLIQAPARPIL